MPTKSMSRRAIKWRQDEQSIAQHLKVLLMAEAEIMLAIYNHFIICLMLFTKYQVIHLRSI